MIVNTPAKVEVNCNTASITADSSITVDSPTTNWTGNISLTGALTVSTSVTSASVVSGTVTATEVSAGGKALSAHTHPVSGVQSGGSTVTSSPPT
jgi:phage baseplate assembly protein gpV